MDVRTSCEPEIQIDMPLFQGLAPDEILRLRSCLRSKTFPANTIVMSVEQMGEVVYIITSGTVKVHIEQADGTDVILSILGPGDTIGEMSMLDNTGRSASVMTIEETSVLWMDRARFMECLRSMPTLARNLACILSGRLRLANMQIQTLATRDVEGRVARQILAFADRYGTRTADGDIYIPIRLTQSDMAGMIGASRERINKIMVSYKSRGYISVDQNRRIIVHNHKALSGRCA